MYGRGFGRRGQPIKVEPMRKDEREMDATTGNAGRDGFSRLSSASRETGRREPIGSEPVWPSGRYYEDC